jgi:hypothetical protein
MVEQLGGRFSVRLEQDGPVTALSFPRLERGPERLPAAATLH